jgi:hypothetical protein
MVSFSWMYTIVQGPNEQTRAYLTAALVDDHAITIDRSIARFGSVYDLASFDGHFYSDKAPGSSLLAAPVYALARLRDRVFAPAPEGALRPPLSPGSPPHFGAEAKSASEIVNLARNWLMLPFALVGFCALRSLLRRLGRTRASIDLTSIAYSMGCAVLHYSTAFYGHVLVSTLLVVSLWCMACAGVFASDSAPPSARASSPWRYGTLALAGLCAGFAGLTEYQATVVAVLFLVPVLAQRERRVPATLAYLAGAVPCALLLFAYNKAAFGGPLSLSYQHLVGANLQSLHGNGLAGATWPTREAILGLLFSAHRGLITTSPWTVFGLFGLYVMRRANVRSLRTTLVLCTAYLFLAVASSSVWHGGWAFGPRLLIPAMPLLAIAAAYACDALVDKPLVDAIARAFVIFGVLYQQLVQTTFSELPPELQWPLRESVAPVVRSTIVTPNLMCKVMPWGQPNLIPLLASLLALSVFIAWPRTASLRNNLTRTAASFVLTGTMFWGLWSIEPNSTPQQQLEFAGWIRTFVPAETSCATFPPVH